MTTPGGRAALAGLAVAVGLAASWFVPAVAIVVVWPLLLFVPGWLALGMLHPRVDLPGRVGLAVVLSVAASAHLVYWGSHLAGGYGREVVLAMAGVLAVTVPLTVWRHRGGSFPHIGATGRAAGAVAAVATLFVGATLAAGMWQVTPTGVTSGGTNWSDLGVHLSIAQSLNAGGNFPPDVPFFAGAPLVYHWFADLHAAMLASAADLFAVPAMIVQSAALAGALALLVFSLARRLARGRRARRVGALAAILVVFGGGLGYSLFVRDLVTPMPLPDGSLVSRSALELIAANSYDNQWLTEWPYFRIPSVMGTGLLAHRATTAGLPILVGAILLFVAGLPSARQRAAGLRDRPALIGLAGLVGALLAPFHFFFFPVVPLLALAWVVTAGRLADREAPRNALAFGAPYLLAIPFAISAASQAGGSGAVRVVGIWQSAPVADGAGAVAFFYVTNLGLPFALAVAALVLRSAPRASFLAIWLGVLFLIPNLFQFSVIDFDMNKYFQAMWIAVGILAAWLVRSWPIPAVAVVVALSIPSPLLVAGWTATSRYQVLSSAELEAAAWVARNTPADAVFATDGWLNSLTDAAGRRRLTSFAPYIANLGYRPDERVEDVRRIYCGGDGALSVELMRRYGASYLVDGGRPQPCDDPVDFATVDEFELVYDAGPLIWRLSD